MLKKKYLVTYTVTIDSEDELSRDDIIDTAWTIMESTYVEPSVDDISDDK